MNQMEEGSTNVNSFFNKSFTRISTGAQGLQNNVQSQFSKCVDLPADLSTHLAIQPGMTSLVQRQALRARVPLIVQIGS